MTDHPANPGQKAHASNGLMTYQLITHTHVHHHPTNGLKSWTVTATLDNPSTAPTIVDLTANFNCFNIVFDNGYRGRAILTNITDGTLTFTGVGPLLHALETT